MTQAPGVARGADPTAVAATTGAATSAPGSGGWTRSDWVTMLKHGVYFGVLGILATKLFFSD